jgi:hypothetical protein
MWNTIRTDLPTGGYSILLEMNGILFSYTEWDPDGKQHGQTIYYRDNIPWVCVVYIHGEVVEYLKN